MFAPFLLLLFSTLCPSGFTNILMGKRELFVLLTVFLRSCDSQCSVALAQSTVGWLRCVIVLCSDHTHLLFCVLSKWICLFSVIVTFPGHAHLMLLLLAFSNSSKASISIKDI